MTHFRAVMSNDHTDGHTLFGFLPIEMRWRGIRWSAMIICFGRWFTTLHPAMINNDENPIKIWDGFGCYKAWRVTPVVTPAVTHAGEGALYLRHPLPSFVIDIIPYWPISGKVSVKRILIGPCMEEMPPREFGMRRHARELYDEYKIHR